MPENHGFPAPFPCSTPSCSFVVALKRSLPVHCVHCTPPATVRAFGACHRFVERTQILSTEVSQATEAFRYEEPALRRKYNRHVSQGAPPAASAFKGNLLVGTVIISIILFGVLPAPWVCSRCPLRGLSSHSSGGSGGGPGDPSLPTHPQGDGPSAPRRTAGRSATVLPPRGGPTCMVLMWTVWCGVLFLICCCCVLCVMCDV